MSFLDENEVERLRVVYNKEYPSKTAIPKGNPEKTWRELTKRLASNCKTSRQACVIGHLFRKAKAPETWFENIDEWLSSEDIDEVEKRYQTLFADYFYVATVPIDFDLKSETKQCLVSALCAMKIQEIYKKGKERIGIVINTDTHDGPGQHWVAVFCDIRPELEYPRITYFDSYAHSPEPEIKELMIRWKQQWDETGIHKKPMRMTFNKTRHQFKDSECGMYCLFFHYACLLELPMDKRIPDDVINGFRGLLFSIPKIGSEK